MEKLLPFVCLLRQNARETLTNISKKTSIPVSTLYDRLRTTAVIKKHTALLDFSALGYQCRALLCVRVERANRDMLQHYLERHPSLNSLYKINNGFDFFCEGIFRHVKDLEDFLDTVDAKFKLVGSTVYYIIEELCREKFMTDPVLYPEADELLDKLLAPALEPM
jgi:DNA-binding Lrp family transcriptional regulator